MGRIEDLYTLVHLLNGFNLPVSPILEYAIKEKMEEFASSDGCVEYTSFTGTKNIEYHKNPPSALRVEFPDGTVICNVKAAVTLRDTINRIGPELVEILCFSEPALRPCNVDLVSKFKTSDERYVSCLYQLENGYYLFTKASTEVKKRQLEFIRRALSLNLKVDIVKRSAINA